jgi:hypothetical protein
VHYNSRDYFFKNLFSSPYVTGFYRTPLTDAKRNAAMLNGVWSRTSDEVKEEYGKELYEFCGFNGAYGYYHSGWLVIMVFLLFFSNEKSAKQFGSHKIEFEHGRSCGCLLGCHHISMAKTAIPW